MVQNVNGVYFGLSTDTKPIAYVNTGTTFTETDTCNIYMFDGAAWQPNVMVYKDLAQIINGAGMAAGATVYSNWIDGLQWVRSISVQMFSDQVYEIDITKRSPGGDICGDITLSAGPSGGWVSRIFTSQTSTSAGALGIIGYSARFGIKNTAAVPNTIAKAYIQLMGA